MYHLMDVSVRSMVGGVGTHDLAAGESLALGTASDHDSARRRPAIVPANGAVTRPREARAR